MPRLKNQPVKLEGAEQNCGSHHHVTREGRVYRYFRGLFIELDQRRPHKNGYPRVRMDGVHLCIHRLVAEAYLPRIPGKNAVNHKDFDKTNNHVDNLEWVSESENYYHAAGGGRVLHPPKAVMCVNEKGEGFFFRSHKEGEKYGFRATTIGAAVKGKPHNKAVGYEWHPFVIG